MNDISEIVSKIIDFNICCFFDLIRKLNSITNLKHLLARLDSLKLPES